MTLFHYEKQGNAWYEVFEGKYKDDEAILQTMKRAMKEDDLNIKGVEHNFNLNCTTIYTNIKDNFFRIYGALISEEKVVN